jgi:hypothetical protein
MPDFAAWTPSDWSALSAVITALVAVAAAAFAFMQVRHARLLREEQAQPFVVVDFESSPIWHNAIELVIRNIGKTVATDVRVEFDPPLQSTHAPKGYELSKSALVTRGIPAMPPGKQISALFDFSHDRKDADLPMSYTAIVRFADARGRRQEALTYVLDLNFVYGLTQFTELGIHDAAKALSEMRDLMASWTAHNNGVRVHTVDEDARNFSDQWQMERSGEHPSLARPVPAGRRTPSRFDRYREPLWRRIYWAIRQEKNRRLRIQEIEEKVRGRPDIGEMLQHELARLRASRWGAFRRRKWSE